MRWAHRVGLRWAQWRIRRRNLFTVDVRTALSSGGEAIIFLPEEEVFLRPALEVCRRLSAWFHPVHLMVLTTSQFPPDLTQGGLPALAVPNAVNRWGLPYRPVIRRVREMTPAVTISLHPQFHLASAYLCVESGAALRIGLCGPGDGFFNLQYTWNNADGMDASEHYRNFLATLADLRVSSDV